MAYNILPIHDTLADHHALQFPEVRAAVLALQTVGKLPRPPSIEWKDGMDILDWLGSFFGFQSGNIQNQREHLGLLLANHQMRVNSPEMDKLADEVVSKLCRKVTKNYVQWCRFLRIEDNLKIAAPDGRMQLLYTALFLLIWGEAANLRFMPECLCFIFHHMLRELHNILEDRIDANLGRVARPASFNGGFLRVVVTPLYQIVRAESDACQHGKTPHSEWRNYDDMNEYFWDKKCFDTVGWPLSGSSNYFVRPGSVGSRHKVGKTGFVEQRTFWNIYRSFDRLWIGLILFLQAAIILAWNASEPRKFWVELQNKDQIARILSIFATWAGLRFLQAVINAVTQYKLVSSQNLLLGLRMILKILVAVGWTVAFAVLWSSMWSKRKKESNIVWSSESNRRFRNFIYTVAAFLSPEALALLLFITPWLRKSVEKSNWRLFNILTWWFQSRIYVARGLRESVADGLRYAIFWVVVIAVKFAFSYYLQIEPLIRPTKETLNLPPGSITYRWNQIFSRGNRIAILVMWAPVLLIYFMDMQLWYSVCSSFVGALVGLFRHIGEIRSVGQLGERFKFFAQIAQFALVADNTVKGPREKIFTRTWRQFKDKLTRVTLRYGLQWFPLGIGDLELEPGNILLARFSIIWNKIISTFREEDIISDRELELLEMPPSVWNINVVQWPAILINNSVLVILGQLEKHIKKGKDGKGIWRKISQNKYQKAAISESYQSVRHVLRRIVSEETPEHTLTKTILEDIDVSIENGHFFQKFELKPLRTIHKQVVELANALLKWRDGKMSEAQVVTAVQNLFDTLIRDFPRDRGAYSSNSVGNGNGNVYPLRAGELLFAAEASLKFPDREDTTFFKQLKRLHTTLTTKETLVNVPQNLEAKRRITFFANSVFMHMPRAPQVDRMLGFSVLTPYYKETVLFEHAELEKKTEDGVTTMFYLKKIFPDDWKNFVERMKSRHGFLSEREIESTEEGLFERRLWASYRGQTLARTVRGMMYYSKALELLAFIDTASELHLNGARERGGLQQSGAAVDSRSMRELSQRHTGLASSQEKYHAMAAMKFTYVAACQVYGEQKAKKETQAADIQYLLKTYEGLRVAYVDVKDSDRDASYSSVLVKYDPATQSEVEVYRVNLPGPLILGEGKPENQNHALIFTRGDALQTIDMNQENYFEEALKMRNLLEEFHVVHGRKVPTILGVREHVFTGAVSSLAKFMSAQETSFVTLGQRVLATPLKVRMHYGHPDVFDRLWFLTRGGISKASKVINISEDIFAGFNCTERGGNVTHQEYIQVGKGRDVGLNQISMFEGKVASGNGEQVLSRDVYRLGHHLDFFRMLSFYYTTVGFFVSNMTVVLCVYAFLWGRVYLALSGVESSIAHLDNKALTASLNQQFLVQLGIFSALPMVVENTLEKGFGQAVWQFILMQLQLSSIFFTFSLGTRAHYFGRTILHGGAKYRATGRGFVVAHEKFAENYRFYSRSHFVKGLELVLLLVVYECFGANRGTVVYILITISSWFLALTWLMAPFVFNPSGFDWLKTVEDWEDFNHWIFFREVGFTDAKVSWERWWDEEQAHLEITGLVGKAAEIVLNCRFLFFQWGIVYRLNIADGSRSIVVYLVSWLYVLGVALFVAIFNGVREKYGATRHSVYRLVQLLYALFVILVFVVLSTLTQFKLVDVFISFLAFVPTGWALLQIAQVLRHPFLGNTQLWPVVVAVARLYEYAMGLLVMVPVACLSWFPGFQSMQTRMLFNEAFSRGLHIMQILTGKNPNSTFTS